MKTDLQKKEAVDECCDIAESIIDEINLLNLADGRGKNLSCDARQKGSLKRKIMRQIKQARQIATSCIWQSMIEIYSYLFLL